MTWEEWLASDEGKSCANWATLSGPKYLKNRLWWAFNAGLKSSQFMNSERPAESETPAL